MARRSKVIAQLAFGATTSSLFPTVFNCPLSTFMRNLVTLLCRSDSPLGFQQHVHGIRPSIPEIKPDAPVGKLRDGRRNAAAHQIPASRHTHRVPRPPKTAVEHQLVPYQSVAGRTSAHLG